MIELYRQLVTAWQEHCCSASHAQQTREAWTKQEKKNGCCYASHMSSRHSAFCSQCWQCVRDVNCASWHQTRLQIESYTKLSVQWSSHFGSIPSWLNSHRYRGIDRSASAQSKYKAIDWFGFVDLDPTYGLMVANTPLWTNRVFVKIHGDSNGYD